MMRVADLMSRGVVGVIDLLRAFVVSTELVAEMAGR